MVRQFLRRSSPVLVFSAIGVGAVVVLVSVSLVQELRRRVLLEQQIRALRTDIEARERHIGELRRLQEYFRTDAYVERVAREKLSYQRLGEQVVVVPEQSAQPETVSVQSRTSPTVSPVRAWFTLLFGPS